MTLLVAWWSLFLNQSISKQRILSTQIMESKLKLLAWEITHQEQRPGTGILEVDERYEIIGTKPSQRRVQVSLQPTWPQLWLRARDIVIHRLEEDFRDKRLMLIGESGFLLLLVLMSVIFLYKYIQLGKRSTLEMEEFWRRMTHEIKTPITGMKLFLQSIKNKSLNENQTSDYVDLALMQVEKQEKLFHNILSGITHLKKRGKYECNRLDGKNKTAP